MLALTVPCRVHSGVSRGAGSLLRVDPGVSKFDSTLYRNELGSEYPIGLLFAVQGQSYGPMFDEKLTHAAWRTRPSWYVIATEDRILPTALQEARAHKSGEHTVFLPTCHVAMMQEPGKVADVLTEAARNALKQWTDSSEVA